MTELARNFFDGRTPTEKRVKSIFGMLDADGDGQITLEEMVQGAQRMHGSFAHTLDTYHMAVTPSYASERSVKELMTASPAASPEPPVSLIEVQRYSRHAAQSARLTRPHPPPSVSPSHPKGE